MKKNYNENQNLIDGRTLKGKNKSYCFNINELLGVGAFGRVYEAFNTLDKNDKYAIKEVIIPYRDPEDEGLKFIKAICEREISELEAIRKHSSDHIIKLFEIIRVESTIYMIMEFCEGKDLKIFLHDKQNLSTEVIIYLFNQILEGFKVLRKGKGKMHRDIKPENILVKEGKLKLSDFQFVIDDNSQTQGIGTPGYMAPEMICEADKDHSKVDIFSLGVLLYWLITRKTPWEEKIKEKQLVYNTITVIKEMQDQLKDKNSLWYPENIKIDDDLKKLITRMMAYTPKERIGWDELFNHYRLKQDLEKVRPNLPIYLHGNAESAPMNGGSFGIDFIERDSICSIEWEALINDTINKSENDRKLNEKFLTRVNYELFLIIFMYNTLVKMIRYKKLFQKQIYLRLLFYLSKLIDVHMKNLFLTIEKKENPFKIEDWECFQKNGHTHPSYKWLYEIIEKDKNKMDTNFQKVKNTLRQTGDETTQLLLTSDEDLIINPKMLTDYTKSLISVLKDFKKTNFPPENYELLLFIEDIFLLLTMKTSFDWSVIGNFDLISFYERRFHTGKVIMIKRIEGHYSDIEKLLF